MQTLTIAHHPTQGVETITTEFLIKFVGLYALLWFTVSLDMPTPIRYLVGGVLIFAQFTSFFHASCIMLFILFLPFAVNLLGSDISGLDMKRLAFLPFMLQAFNSPKLRNLHFERKGLVLVVGSVAIIMVSAYIRHFVQDMPMTAGQKESFGVTMMITQTYDTIVPILFLYYTYTRLRLTHLNQLFDLLILLAGLEAISILYLVSQNPAMVFDQTEGGEFNKDYLWKSQHFGHKNNWGLVLVMMFFVGFIRYRVRQNNRLFYMAILSFLVMGIAVSLSRQAYLTLVYGFVLIAFWKRSFGIIFVMVCLGGLVAIAQPDFLIDRLTSMTEVESTEDFQELNTKVGDAAINQIKENFSLIPQMFYKDWEYNWSEGFWNGLMHQLGILGLFMILTMYYLMFNRFSKLKRHKRYELYGILGMLIITIMFLSNFNRRYSNINHYNGKIAQNGFVVLYVFFYLELIYRLIERRVRYVLKM